jgi:hypothetical protein
MTLDETLRRLVQLNELTELQEKMEDNLEEAINNPVTAPLQEVENEAIARNIEELYDQIKQGENDVQSK